MKTFPLRISSPEGDVFCGDAQVLSLRGTEGELAIMAGHVPFVTAVVACDCSVTLADGCVRTAHTEGGLLTVGAHRVVLLSGSFGFTDETK